jgi:hypothetical protein
MNHNKRRKIEKELGLFKLKNTSYKNRMKIMSRKILAGQQINDYNQNNIENQRINDESEWYVKRFNFYLELYGDHEKAKIDADKELESRRNKIVQKRKK